ncbi:bifunctional nicotinamide-nucleotide adenylyltransferase/Nudix hydroxylase [Accumulibacter sp.]|uniref:bifunctional nicotinamide-nucleotide adenylyltransferase/Nudix hydroxylase n=1 Tax=Accumulibacter sp. TaxID=2053492 RepID=UPI0026041BBC|nr:bifunctional nicotinamide-nucleotide adenylyltransferase/Nudix hydroxylase [Accumulibacter sp.]
MSQTYDSAVLIGRFQPFHNAHAQLLALALQTAGQVLVVLGSAHAARNAKNPFTWEERAAMIGSTLDAAERARVHFLPVRDYYDDRRWGAAVSTAVQAHTAATARIALVGHVKDASSEYLQRFPRWHFVAAPACDSLDATSLRRIYFDSDRWPATQALLGGLAPPAIVDYLKGWRHLPHYARLRDEHLALEEYRQTWGSGPFVTVDAVVTAAAHVLLVERADGPGKGLWAVPGGFLEPRERVLQGAVRELREETGLVLLAATLESLLRGVAVFDHPDRSLRGRSITHAHWFDLGDCRLPEVAGDDDAAQAKWIPIADLKAMEGEFFEDHFNLLDHFLALHPEA